MSFINLARLYSASFKGVEFLYVTGSTTAGRKTAVHEFPQKDFRYVEDLGKNLRSFDITAEISGAFYETKKKRLEDALSAGGIGVLIHPVYGAINAVCLGYTLTDDTREVGIAKFELTFLEANPNVFPAATGRTKSIISNLYNTLYDFVENDLDGEFIASFTNNIFDAGQKIISISDVLNGVVATLDPFSSDDKNAFTADANFVTVNAYRLPTDPSELADKTTSLINQFDKVPSSAEDRFKSGQAISGFGSDDITLNGIDSVQLNQRYKNRRLLNAAVNVLALTNMYDSAASIDYDDDIQLNDIRESLENTYNILINADYNFITTTTLDELQALRNNVEQFFEQTSLTVNKVTTIDTAEIPVGVLTYQYYGELNNYQEIVDLNEVPNPLTISGEVRILTV